MLTAAMSDFDFNDPKGVNTIRFTLDAPLETISGTGNGVSGTVSFDPKSPEKTTGSIILKTESLKVPNGKMLDHMLGKGWLNAGKYSEIKFELSSITDVK